nr:MAG TPA: hypothetical protein [Caudoviricetes sp.]
MTHSFLVTLWRASVYLLSLGEFNPYGGYLLKVFW